MSVIGFNFTKISVERKSATQGKINVSSNIAIKDVEHAKIALSGSQVAGVKFTFMYFSKYEPSVGDINLEGEVIYMADKEEADEVVESWQKNKSVSKDIMKNVLNTALTKCTVEAMVLSRDLNLPSPIPIPKVNVSSGEKAMPAKGTKE